VNGAGNGGENIASDISSKSIFPPVTRAEPSDSSSVTAALVTQAAGIERATVLSLSLVFLPRKTLNGRERDFFFRAHFEKEMKRNGTIPMREPLPPSDLRKFARVEALKIPSLPSSSSFPFIICSKRGQRRNERRNERRQAYPSPFRRAAFRVLPKPNEEHAAQDEEEGGVEEHGEQGEEEGGEGTHTHGGGQAKERRESALEEEG